MPMPQHAPERTRPDIDNPSRVTEPNIIPHPTEDPFKREFEEIIKDFDTKETVEHPHGDHIKKSTDLVVIEKKPADQEPETGDKTPELKEEEHGGDDKETIKLVVAGLDREISARAAAAANTRLDRELGEKRNFFSKLVVRAWKGHAMRDMYLTRYRIEAERAIRENKDLYYGDDTGVNATYKADTVTRYLQDFENDLILHERAGETREKLDDSPEATLIKNTLYDLMRRAAMPGSGLTDRAAFQTEADTALHELSLNHPEITNLLESSDIFAHNLFDGWKAIEAVMSKEGLDIEEALSRTEISVGEARAGARSEYHRTVSDRLIERMSKTRIANLVNEDTVAITTAAIYGGLLATGKAIVGIKSALLLMPGVAGGIWAGMRESTRVKQERDKLAQDVAEGRYQLDETLEGRTAKLREAIFDQESVEDIRTGLGSFFETDRSTGELRVNIDTPEKLKDALQAIGNAKALIDTSDEQDRDLLHSSTRSLDKVRGDLMSDLAALQVEIRRMVPTMDDAHLDAMGVPASQYTTVRSGDPKMFVNSVVETHVNVAMGVSGTTQGITEAMAARSRTFNALQVERVLFATGVGLGMGATMSVITQEVGAIFSDKVAGIFEGNGTSGEKATLLRSWFRGTNDTIIPSPTQEVNISGTATTTLPEGYTIKGSDGAFTLSGPQNLKVEGLKLDSSGVLTDKSLDAIKSAGFGVDIDTSNMTLAPVQENITVTPQQFLDNHQDMKTFKVDKWLNYGTPKSNLNELRLGDSHRDADGNINIKSWFKGDSTNGHGYAYNPGEGAKNGSLQYSVTIGNKAYFFDIADNGNIKIPADHPAAVSLFDKDGNLTANYGRAVEVVGEQDGVVHVNSVATEIGQKNITTLTDVTTKNAPEGSITYTISGPPQIIEREPIAPPFIFGPLARGGLQVPERRSQPPITPVAPSSPPPIVAVPERKAISGPPQRKAITAAPNGGWTADFQGPTTMKNGSQGSLYRSTYASVTREPDNPPATPPTAPEQPTDELRSRPPIAPEQGDQPPQPNTPTGAELNNPPSASTPPSAPPQNQPRTREERLAQERQERETLLAQIDSEVTTNDAVDAAGDRARLTSAGFGLNEETIQANVANARSAAAARRSGFTNDLRQLMSIPERYPLGMARLPSSNDFRAPQLVNDIVANVLANNTSQPNRQVISTSTDPETLRAVLRSVWSFTQSNLDTILDTNNPLTPSERRAFEQAREYTVRFLQQLEEENNPILQRFIQINQNRAQRRAQRQQQPSQG